MDKLDLIIEEERKRLSETDSQPFSNDPLDAIIREERQRTGALSALESPSEEPEKGGFDASGLSAAGGAIKSIGQGAQDFLGADSDNIFSQYGQELIDENPTAIRSFEDVPDNKILTVKEATGNVAASLPPILAARAVGMGITAASPFTGPAMPFVAGLGQLIAWVGPAAVAALPSYGSIREKQIFKDPKAVSSYRDKAVALFASGTIGAIETRFGPQNWALAMLTKEGRNKLAKQMASKNVVESVAKGTVRGGLIEGTEELVQSPIEQLASYDDPTSDESIEETVFGGFMGFVGGGVLGGGVGGVSYFAKPGEEEEISFQDVDIFPPTPSEEQEQLPKPDSDPVVTLPDGSAGRKSDIEKFILGLPENEREEARESLLNVPEAPPPPTQEESFDTGEEKKTRTAAEELITNEINRANEGIDSTTIEDEGTADTELPELFPEIESGETDITIPETQETVEDQAPVVEDAKPVKPISETPILKPIATEEKDPPKKLSEMTAEETAADMVAEPVAEAAKEEAIDDSGTETITVYDALGNAQELPVVDRSEAGTVIVKTADGNEVIVGAGEFFEDDINDPDFKLESVEGAPSVSELDDSALQTAFKLVEIKRKAFEEAGATNQAGYYESVRDRNAIKVEQKRRAAPAETEEAIEETELEADPIVEQTEEDVEPVSEVQEPVAEEAELDEKVKEYKGVAYSKNRKDAEARMKKFAPEGKVVEYERGYAVQVRISGPYLDKSGNFKEVELDEAGEPIAQEPEVDAVSATEAPTDEENKATVIEQLLQSKGKGISGKDNKDIRETIMTTLLGRKVKRSEKSVTNVEEALKNLLGDDWAKYKYEDEKIPVKFTSKSKKKLEDYGVYVPGMKKENFVKNLASADAKKIINKTPKPVSWKIDTSPSSTSGTAIALEQFKIEIDGFVDALGRKLGGRMGRYSTSPKNTVIEYSEKEFVSLKYNKSFDKTPEGGEEFYSSRNYKKITYEGAYETVDGVSTNVDIVTGIEWLRTRAAEYLEMMDGLRAATQNATTVEQARSALHTLLIESETPSKLIPSQNQSMSELDRLYRENGWVRDSGIDSLSDAKASLTTDTASKGIYPFGPRLNKDGQSMYTKLISGKVKSKSKIEVANLLKISPEERITLQAALESSDEGIKFDKLGRAVFDPHEPVWTPAGKFLTETYSNTSSIYAQIRNNEPRLGNVSDDAVVQKNTEPRRERTRVEDIVRTGLPDHILSDDVTSKYFSNLYRFKRVEVGESVENWGAHLRFGLAHASFQDLIGVMGNMTQENIGLGWSTATARTGTITTKSGKEIDLSNDWKGKRHEIAPKEEDTGKKKSKKAKQAEDRINRIKDFFAVGNIVPSYDGFDKVESLKLGKYDNGSETFESVTVYKVKENEEGVWVDAREGSRTHSTSPGNRDEVKSYADNREVAGKLIKEGDTYRQRWLGLAFATRGRGRHAAHFEPDTHMINLTHRSGDGALSHEWSHGLDERISTNSIRGKKVVEEFQTVLKLDFDLYNIISNLESIVKKGKITDYNNPIEQAESYIDGGWERGRVPMTQYGAQAKQLGKYWEREKELWARSFESFVYDEIKAKGGDSPYLVSDFAAEGRFTPNGGYAGNPYPSGEERVKFNSYWRDLVDNGIVWKDGNPSIKEDFVTPMEKIRAEVNKELATLRDKLEEMRANLLDGNPWPDGNWWYGYEEYYDRETKRSAKNKREVGNQPKNYIAFDDEQGAIAYNKPVDEKTREEYKIERMPDDWLPSDTANYLGDEDGDRIRDDGDEALADTSPQNVSDLEEGEDSTEGGGVGVGVGASTRRKPSSSGDGLGRGKRISITNVRTPAERGRGGDSKPGTDTIPAPTGDSLSEDKGIDYRITDEDNIGQGTIAEQFEDNFKAIELLNNLENNGVIANLADQKILVKYVGWNRMPYLFNQYTEVPGWGRRTDRLKTLLSEEEFEEQKSIAKTTGNSSVGAIKAMWSVLQRLGFKGGRVIEPALGSGHFFGLMPDNLKEQSTLLGIEKDNLTSRIVKQLYQTVRIQNKGYEDLASKENWYDLVITSIPFDSSIKPADDTYNKERLSLELFYVNKAIATTRPGGFVAILANTELLDGTANQSRLETYSENAEIVGSLRLPSNGFEGQVGAMDMIFLRKKVKNHPLWIGETADKNRFDQQIRDDFPGIDYPTSRYAVNEYYKNNPEFVVGEMKEVKDAKNSFALGVELAEGEDLQVKLAQAIEQLPKDIVTDVPSDAETEMKEAALQVLPEGEAKDGGYLIQKDLIYQREGKTAILAGESKSRGKIIRSSLKLRDAARKLIHARVNDGSEKTATAAKAEIVAEYKKFVKNHGFTHEVKNISAFFPDPDGGLLVALEKWDAVTEKGSFRELDLKIRQEITSAENAEEALTVTLNQKGKIQWSTISTLLGISEEKAKESLRGQVFDDPSMGWVTAEEYLSGNVKSKLELARGVAASDPKFDVNVAALEAVQPKELDSTEIRGMLGASWIPGIEIANFITEKLDTDSKEIVVNFLPEAGRWTISGGRGRTEKVKKDYLKLLKRSSLAINTWGTSKQDFLSLMTFALNGGFPVVKDKQKTDVYGDLLRDGNDKVIPPKINAKETEAAKGKLEAIKEEFERWIWDDSDSTVDRKKRMSVLYNNKVNKIRLRENYTYPATADQIVQGDRIRLPNMAVGMSLMRHQANAVWRTVQSGNVYYAHEVGTGKTFTIVASAMELKRLGKIKKPIIGLKKSTVNGIMSEFLRLYPGANILHVELPDINQTGKIPEERFAKHKKQMERIRDNDWDAVIVSHEGFSSIPVGMDALSDLYNKEIKDLTVARSAAEAMGRSETMVNTYENEIESTKVTYEAAKSKVAKMQGKTLTFEELGIDHIFIDEAHEFKNLSFKSRIGRTIRGLDPKGSKKSFDLFTKTTWINAQRDNGQTEGGVVLASGTPLSNSVGELFAIQRYLQPDELKRQGLHRFDVWASTYGRIGQRAEAKPTGAGYQMVTMFNRFVNLPELMKTVYSVMDPVSGEMAGVKRPKIKGGKPTSVVVPQNKGVKDYLEILLKRAEEVKNNSSGAEHEGVRDNMLRIVMDGRKAAMDMRLINPANPDYPETKVNVAAKQILKVYKKEQKNKGVQLVFADLGVPSSKKEFDIYNDLKDKLIKLGIKKSEIAFAQDAKKGPQQAKLLSRVNAGEVRVFMGSTSVGGTGINIQERVAAIYNLDTDWNMAKMLQRNGRGHRQGNIYKELSIGYYGTEGTVDSFMWDKVFAKQRLWDQVMSGDMTVREAEDLSVNSMSAREMMATINGDPRLLEKAELEDEVAVLSLQSASHEDSKLQARKALVLIPEKIKALKESISQAQEAKDILDSEGALFAKDGKVKYNQSNKQSLAKFVTAINKDFDAATAAGKKDKTRQIALRAKSDKLSETNKVLGEKEQKEFDAIVAKGSGSLIKLGKKESKPVSGKTKTIELFAYTHNVTTLKFRSERGDLNMPIKGEITASVLVEASNKYKELKEKAEDDNKNQEAEILNLKKAIDALFPKAEELDEKRGRLKEITNDLLALGKQESPDKVDTGESQDKTSEDDAEKEGDLSDPAPSLAIDRSGKDDPMSVAQVKSISDVIKSKWENPPNIIVVKNVFDPAVEPIVKAAVLRHMEQESTVGGVSYEKNVYLFADELFTNREVVEALFHESLGHFGMRGAFGKDYEKVLDDIILRRRELVREKAENYQYDMKEKASRRQAADEVLAEMAQTNPKISFVKRAIAIIRAWLRKNFPKIFGKLKLTDNEIIVKYLMPAREFVQDGGQVGIVESDSTPSFILSKSGKSKEGSSKDEEGVRARHLEEFRKWRNDHAARPPVPPEDAPEEFDELNAKFREENKTLWEKSKKMLRKGLAPGGLLPKAVFNKMVDRNNVFAVIEFDVVHRVGVLERAIKKEYKIAAEDLDAKVMELLDNVMAGKIEDVPKDTQIALMQMRQYIDSLSRKYLVAVNRQIKTMRQIYNNDRIERGADEITAEQWNDAGFLNDILAEEDGRSLLEAIIAKQQHRDTINGNIGQYVHRSYKAFDDPKWFKSISDKVLNEARQYLIGSMIEGGMSESKAIKRAEVVLYEITKNGTAYDGMDSFIRESKLGAKDLSVLKQRKDIHPKIRALLGEYKDPRVNFSKSATKMGRMIFNQTFLEKVKEAGMGTFLFTNATKPPEATTKIAADSSDVMSPLNGLWTTPEINKAFIDALSKSNMANWLQTIIKVNGMVKYGKTILSPTTAARNWMSAFFFSMANGHWNLSYATKSVTAMSEYFSQMGSEEKLKYLRKLKLLGVIYDTPYAGEMIRLLADTQLMSEFATMGKTKLKVKKALSYATKFYQFGDDFWKIIGFENEKKIWMKEGLDEQQAEKKAAERIRNTYPTYSMVGKWMQNLRRFPLAGTFVSFPAEIIRTSINMVKYVAEDYAAGRTKMAFNRGFGLALVSSLAFAGQELSKAILGLDDDDEEAVRLMAAPWQRNANLYFTGFNEEGKIEFLDLSFMDPYNYFKRPINAVTRGQPFDKALMDVLEETLAPFLGEDIAAGVIKEAITNKKATGAPVFRERDDAINQARDIFDHLRKTLQPGIFSNVERTLKAIEGEVSPSGKKYNLSDEVWAVLGFRFSTLDPKVALYYRSFDFKDAKADAGKHVTMVIRDTKEVDADDMESALNTANRLRITAYTEMNLLVKAAIRNGLSKKLIRSTLKNSGISEDDIRAIMTGKPVLWKGSKASKTNQVKKAKATFGIEGARRVRQRFKELNALAKKLKPSSP